MSEAGKNGSRKGSAAERSARARARQRRRAAALRANLARRKTQARARGGADGVASAPVDGGDGSEAGG